MKNLKSLLTATGLSLATILGTSCTSDIYGSGPSTQRGSVTGGITGAALGAIVGNQSGRPLEGAAIGGLIGAAAGSTLGNAQDQENGYITPTRYYRPSPPVIRHDYHYHSYMPRPPRRYFAPVRPRSIHLHYRN